MLELSQNMWQRYGFSGNPFDTGALSASQNALLPIAQAIVGRGLEERESRLLRGVIASAGGGRAVVEGDVGVGKTTFVNYHRYLWENEAQDKLLTPSNEISLSGEVGVRDVLWSITGALLSRFVLLKGSRWVHKRPVLRELTALHRVFLQNSFELQASLFGFGVGGGRSAQVNVPEPSEGQLLELWRGMIEEAEALGYKGIFLHFDNLELLSLRNPERTRQLFEDLRDLLQTPGVYWVFVGQAGFFSEIVSPSERVRSVFFGQPIYIPPLSKEQLLQAAHKRYQLLAARRDQGKTYFIEPVTDDLLEYLYDLYDGKIRFVLDAVTTVVTDLPQPITTTLEAREAKSFLTALVFQRLRRELTPREWDVLREAVRHKAFTNSDIRHALNLKSPNVTKYLNTLLDKRCIYPQQRSGRQMFYCASEDVRIIRDVPPDLQQRLFEGRTS